MTLQELQSPEIDQIIPALIKAKKNFKSMVADNKGQYETKKSLLAIEDATTEALSNEDLWVQQTRCIMEDRVCVRTLVAHKSGQWIAAYMPLTKENDRLKGDQAWGASNSYQRRQELYGLWSLGKGEDDPDDYQNKEEEVKEEPITQAQLYKLQAIIKQQPEQLQQILNKYQVKDISELYKSEATYIISSLVPK